MHRQLKMTKSPSARSKRNSPPTLASPASPRSVDPSEELLGQYFRDVAPIDLLGANQESHSARRIEDTAVAAWEHLLGAPGRVPALLAAASDTLGQASEGFDVELAPLRRSAKALAARHAAKPGRGYASALRRAALHLRQVDSDARALSVALALVEPAGGSFARVARELVDAAIRARNDFVRANLRLVIKIAKRYRNPSMPLVDLIQEGNLGLLEAVKRFDYKRGFRFSTYASWWIRHAICRAIADRGQLVRVPLHLAETRRRIGRARSSLSNRFGESASAEAVADETGIDVAKVRSAEAELMPAEVRLDQEATEGLRYADLIPDPQASIPLEQVEQRDASSKALQLVDELDPVEAEIIRRRFGIDGREPQTLREIARDYNLSRERIRQIELKGLGRIRKRLLRSPIRSTQITTSSFAALA